MFLAGKHFMRPGRGSLSSQVCRVMSLLPSQRFPDVSTLFVSTPPQLGLYWVEKWGKGGGHSPQINSPSLPNTSVAQPFPASSSVSTVVHLPLSLFPFFFVQRHSID